MKGRNKSFSEKEALRAAGQVFWEKGYAMTSTRDLARAMNISYSSVYHTFHNKKELLSSVLANAHEVITGRFEDIIEQEENPLEGLRVLFIAFSADMDPSALSKGCLIGNLFAEIDPQEKDLYDLLQLGLNRIQEVFHEALSEAQKRGYLSSGKDLKLLSLHLVNFYEGMMILRRSKVKKAALLKLVELNLSILK